MLPTLSSHEVEENQTGQPAIEPSVRHALRWIPVVLLLLLPLDTASAYIGPGAGFAFLGSFFVFFVAFGLALLALLTLPFRHALRKLRRGSSHARDKAAERAVVVGFDGMEPSLVERFMDQGFLPNFSRLRDRGGYCPLQTTLPPLSPVAWSTFQTGTNPGKHGIFDFLHRNPRTYLGEVSSAHVSPASRKFRLRGLQVPLGRPQIRLLRRSQPFWKILGEHDIFSAVLRVPVSFPPEKFHGVSLSAMCVPDLRGTQGTFSYYTNRTGSVLDRIGGEVIPVQWNHTTLRTWIFGPDHPFRTEKQKLKTRLLVTRESNHLILRVNGFRHSLLPGRFTPWIPVAFRAGPVKLRGIVQFHLSQIEPFLDLYMTPVHIDPGNPSLPISHPAPYATYLAKSHGPFATLGIAEDTWALNEGVLDDRAFWEQSVSIHEERESMFWDALEHVPKGLLICVFDLTDRVQHMFWRYEDPLHPARSLGLTEGLQEPLLKAYQKADAFLGTLVDRLDGDTLLLVISDHGFRTFRRCVNLNSWLHQNGYLFLDPSQKAGEWFQGIDWARTRAYGVGLSGIYINQQGRERLGTVPRAETSLVKGEIISKLSGLRDPNNGEVAVLEVLDTARAYQGPYQEEAPDLVVAYDEGYRTSWESAVGRITDEVFSDNTKKWSGDHAMRPDRIPGVLFCNRRILSSNPRIVDLAPTLLSVFGLNPPAYMDGKVLEFEWKNPLPAGRDNRVKPDSASPPEARRSRMPKVKIDKELFEKVKRCARVAGYSSEHEFIVHALEKHMAAHEEGDSEEEIKNKLKGLGYIS